MMMAQPQVNLQKSILNTPLTRRSILIGGMTLPAVSMLTGCGGGGGGGEVESDVVIPIAPFDPDTTPQIPDQGEKTEPEQGTEPIISPDAVKMNVGIYNFEYNSFEQLRARRKVSKGTAGSVLVTNKDGTETAWESIVDYVKRSVDHRFVLLYRGMLTAFAERPPQDYDVTFFTAPEFYWNVPWTDFLNTDEVLVVADLFLELVTQKVRSLIAKFPECDYGKLVLLPGTIAVLKPSVNIFNKDGSDASTDKNPILEATNHLVCVHNLSLNDEHQRPAYMVWPKRTVSWIDFIGDRRCDRGDELGNNASNPDLENYAHVCTLNGEEKLVVKIQRVSSDKVQAFDDYGRQLLDTTFNNELIEGLPFGINICLDYAVASTTTDKYRMAQLKNTEFKLDFVIAAGISLVAKNYQDASTVQYAIHNDGIKGSNQNPYQVKYEYFSNVSQIFYDKRIGAPYLLSLPALGTTADGSRQSTTMISVDNSTDFTYPERYSGMPSITDEINSANVRVWSLPVDVTDTLKTQETVTAMKSENCEAAVA